MYPQTSEILSPPLPPYTLQPIEQIDDPVPVCVAVRLSPLKNEENRSSCIIRKPHNELKRPGLKVVGPNVPQETFEFDYVLEENDSQNDVYDKLLTPFIPLIYDGYDLFIILYGSKGCGKSYTLFGPQNKKKTEVENYDSEIGLVQRFVDQLYGESYNPSNVKIKVSSFEVTNHDVCDLLVHEQRRQSLFNGSVPGNARELVCHSAAEVMSYFESSLNVASYKEALEDLEEGHSFFRIKIEQNLAGNKQKCSTVTFVDLASAAPQLGMGNKLNSGLFYLDHMIGALGDAHRNFQQQKYEVLKGSHLTKILDNAFGGTALTLFLCCVSPSMENAEQTLDVLHKAKSASNIYNYPKVNLSPDEEISLLTSESKTNTNPLMQMMGMPDLISNPDPLRLNFLMYQQQQQMQQQMLHNYMGMLMVQQQQPQQPQEQHYSASSPFIPITDSPASTLDLKSPSLNENNFPLNIPSGPDINEQNLDRKEELPKNNISNKPSNTKNCVERKKERKNSLATLQNTLDSILEVSENGSSSTRKDSSMMSSLVTSDDDENSNDESYIDDDSTGSDPDEEEEENDDDFDSDCSINSEEIPKEILDVDKFLEKFKENLAETINKEQDQILNKLLIDLEDESKTAHREMDLNNTLVPLATNQETRRSDIDDLKSSMSELLRIKTQLLANLDQVKRSQSSFELKKTLADLELKISTLKIASGGGDAVEQKSEENNDIESTLCKIQTKSQSCAYRKVEKAEEKCQGKTGYIDEKPLYFSSPSEIFNDLRSLKKKYEYEKMILLEHKAENRYNASRCEKCEQAFKEGRFDEDECKRKIEIDVIMELLDILIDSANAQSSGLDAMPYVDNPTEMTFLKSQLENLTPDQLKILVPHLVNRNIDFRMTGRDTDQELEIHDKAANEMRKNLKMYKLENGILAEKLKVQEHKHARNIEKLKAEKEFERERAERYKEYYIRCKEIEKNNAEDLNNRTETGDQIDYDEIATTGADIERPKHRKNHRSRTYRSANTTPQETEKDRRRENSNDQSSKTNVLRKGNKVRISQPVKPYRPENDYK